MELQFPVTNEVLMEPESSPNFSGFRTGIRRVYTLKGSFSLLMHHTYAIRKDRKTLGSRARRE
jgi:hypothetical protein